MRIVMGIMVCCLLDPSAAIAEPRDNAATATYLRADYLLIRQQTHMAKASVAAIEGEGRSVEKGCASVLAEAPKGSQLEELSQEMSSAVLFSGSKPDRSAMLRFAREVAPLRWNSRRVTRLVRAIAASERKGADLRFPDVCADIRAWVASGYKHLTTGTERFLAHIAALEKVQGAEKGKNAEETALMLLRPYERASEKRLAKRIERLEEALADRMFGAFLKVFAKTALALGLR
jgi:hypothetical protein